VGPWAIISICFHKNIQLPHRPQGSEALNGSSVSQRPFSARRRSVNPRAAAAIG
jgi:hypothetical protein